MDTNSEIFITTIFFNFIPWIDFLLSLILSNFSLRTEKKDSHVLELDVKKAQEANEPYDPYLYRKVAHPTT